MTSLTNNETIFVCFPVEMTTVEYLRPFTNQEIAQPFKSPRTKSCKRFARTCMCAGQTSPIHGKFDLLSCCCHGWKTESFWHSQTERRWKKKKKIRSGKKRRRNFRFSEWVEHVCVLSNTHRETSRQAISSRKLAGEQQKKRKGIFSLSLLSKFGAGFEREENFHQELAYSDSHSCNLNIWIHKL